MIHGSRLLLDVNVLVALHRPTHVAHRRAMSWFREEGEKGFGTCAVTEAGFTRIMTNPALFETQIKLSEARELLDYFTGMRGHTFWPARIGFNKLTEPLKAKMQGHRQVMDAYLLGLAIHEKGTLVTLDKAIRHLAGDEFAKHILLIGESA